MKMYKNVLAWCILGIAAVFTLLASSPVHCAPLPGGSLDPLTIPKYVQPLVIPPVMPKSTTSPTPSADYDIAVRQFKQQILPGGVWNVLNGRADAFPATTIWSYGRAEDPTPDVTIAVPNKGLTAGVAPAPNTTFNYPAFTLENTSGVTTNVRWINDLVDPATGNFIPHLFSVDQTLHWANPPMANCIDMPGMGMGANRTDCHTNVATPYTGPVPLVTHVHGAHVQPDSDGYPEAWWLPGAPGTKGIPASYAERGNVFTESVTNNTVAGSAFYSYENTQPASTLWYHDHALGMTRLNVYAGPAGFWLIRGGSNDTASGILPGPPATAGAADPNFNAAHRSTIREIPIAIQDRSFNADGSLFYPADRSFFDGFTGPYIGGIGTPAGPSDISGIWNPEAFFNTMVVNGTTWPMLAVDPVRYRFRLLDGCNSRTLNLSMYEISDAGLDGIMGTADDTLGPEVPFYQIGAEQGFLPKVVKIMKGSVTVLPGNGGSGTAVATAAPEQGLLMGPAERADVIVDFSGLNTKRIRMFNTGPDAPFQGFGMGMVPADLSTTGQVMDFVVNTAAAADPSTPVTMLTLPAEAKLATAITATRQVSLNEMVSDQVCVEIDPITGAMTTLTSVAAGTPNFVATCLATAPQTAGNIVDLAGPRMALLGVLTPGTTAGTLVAVPKMWSDPITETPVLNSTEIWEIYNTTMDAHPIHLHLVRFEVINRQDVDPATLALVGTATASTPTEAGYKDTVVAYPGQVTRIKAKFDIAGLYVWHCHIVEHEDNEMMRPYTVSGLTVSSVATSTPAGTYTTGKAINVTVAFNRPISSTGLTINLSGGGSIATGPLANATGYTGTYTVAAGQDTAQLDVTSIIGTIDDVLMDGNTPLSSVTNPILPAGSNISKSSLIRIDTTAPSLAAVTSSTAAGAYKGGATVNVTLLFSEMITSTAGLTVTLNTGAAALTTGPINTPTASVSMSYLVGSTDNTTPAGQFLDVTAISGTVIDAVNNPTSVGTIPTGSNLSSGVKILIDNTPPTITMTAPTALSTYSNSATQALTGTVSDPAGIKSFTVNGTAVTTSTIGEYTTSAPLTAGSTTTITLVATDMADNQTTSILTVTHDTTLPTVTLTAPTAQYVNNVIQTVSGTATDPSGILSITVNNATVIPDTAGAFSAQVTLTAGTANLITVIVTDRAGNQTTVTKTVTHSGILPIVVFTSPSPIVSNVNQIVSGTATSPIGINSVTINGSAVTLGTGGTFSKAVTLTANTTNTIVVVVDDIAGNQEIINLVVTHDTSLPVTSATPPPGTYSGSVSVTLTASKDNSVIYYTTNGIAPTIASPRYVIGQPILLSSTTTAIKKLMYFAVDQAGNKEAVKTGTYTLHTTDLVAKIAINAGKTFTSTPNVTLALSASDKFKVSAYAISVDGGSTYLPTVAIAPAVINFSKKVPITLPAGNGLKTVFVKFTDGLGVVYDPLMAQITLDATAATTSVTPQPGSYPGGTLKVAFSANKNATIYYTTNGTVPTIKSSIYKKPFDINGVNSTVTVKYFSIDKSGNQEAVKTAIYVFGHLADMIASFKINGGKKYTTSRTVSLAFTASDPVSGGVSSMSFSNDGINFSQLTPYAPATAMPWILSPGNAPKTVYVRFVDKFSPPNTYTYTDRIYLAEGVTLASGDIDDDGAVDLADATKALLAASGLIKLTIPEQARGDVGPLLNGKPDADGVLDVGDALIITQKMIGLVTF